LERLSGYFSTSGKFIRKILAITFYLGDPPQNFTAILRSSEPDLIIVDERCGKQGADCPKYCDDRALYFYCLNVQF
jgi:hypothetical protein